MWCENNGEMEAGVMKNVDELEAGLMKKYCWNGKDIDEKYCWNGRVIDEKYCWNGSGNGENDITRPYHFLKLVSFLGVNRTKSACFPTAVEGRYINTWIQYNTIK